MTSVPSTTNGLQDVQRATSPNGGRAALSLPIAQIRTSAQRICTTCTPETILCNSIPAFAGGISRQMLTDLQFTPARGTAADSSEAEIWLKPSPTAWLGFQFWTLPRLTASTARSQLDAQGLPMPHPMGQVENWLREQYTSQTSTLPSIVAEHCKLASLTVTPNGTPASKEDRNGIPANRVVSEASLRRYQFFPLPSQPTSGWYQKMLADNAYALWKAGSSLRELSELTPAQIPQPEPVSSMPAGRTPEQITLDPATPIYSLPFHLCHQYLYDLQLCATGQPHFSETALTAMGLQSLQQASVAAVTPSMLIRAGFSPSNEDSRLWLKHQLEQNYYWVFRTGYPTMDALQTWFMQAYGNAPNYRLAGLPEMSVAATSETTMARPPEIPTSTTTEERTTEYLLGPATRSLSTYHSTAPFPESRLSHTTTRDYRPFEPRPTEHRPFDYRPFESRPTERRPFDYRQFDRHTEHRRVASQDHYQVPVEVTFPQDLLQTQSSQSAPLTTAPVTIPVVIDLTINRPDPNDMCVNFYPQVEQTQQLPFWVAPQMPQTTLPMHIAPHLSHATMQVQPAITSGQMQVTPSIMPTGMMVQPSITDGQMQVMPSLLPAAMVVTPTITQGQMAIMPTIMPTGMTVQPSITDGQMQVTPEIMPADMAVSPFIARGHMQIMPEIMPTEMTVQPSITDGQVQITPEFMPADMTVSPFITRGRMQVVPEIMPADMTVAPTIAPTTMQIDPTLSPAPLAITPTVASTVMQIVPTRALTPVAPRQLAIEQAPEPRPQTARPPLQEPLQPQIPPQLQPPRTQTPVFRWPSAVPTGDLNMLPRRSAPQQCSPIPTPRLALPAGIPSGSLTQPRPPHLTPPGAIPTFPLPLATHPLGPAPTYPATTPTFPAGAFWPQPSYIPPQPLGPLQPPQPAGVTPPTAPPAQSATLRFSPPRQRQQTRMQNSLFDSDTEE